jgi:hypothetical protein
MPPPILGAHYSGMHLCRQVFWLPDRPTGLGLPIVFDSGAREAFVPGYSGGSAPDLHGIPLLLK